MIGQSKIISVLKNRIPNSLLLLGKSGSGKTTLANYLSEQLSADFAVVEDLNIAEIKNITENANYVSYRRVYCIENVQDMTPLVQNVLLKTLEEANSKITFVLCATTKENILPTILSRCTIIKMDSYTEKELRHYSETRAGNIDISYCKTPGDITYKKYLIEAGIYDELMKLADLITTKITKANTANVFNIINRLETMDCDKKMVLWLIDVLIIKMRDYYTASKLCVEFKHHIIYNNTKWERTFEQLLVKLNTMEV